MQYDVFQVPGYFVANDPSAPTPAYTFLTSVSFLPALDAYFCDLTLDKAYRVLQILSSQDADRTIVVTVPQTISVKKIFDIPGEHPSSTIDIFQGSTKIYPNSGGGYGLVVSTDFVPPLHSFYCVVELDRVYEVLDILYAIGQDRTIVLTTRIDQSIQDIFSLPAGTAS